MAVLQSTLRSMSVWHTNTNAEYRMHFADHVYRISSTAGLLDAERLDCPNPETSPGSGDGRHRPSPLAGATSTRSRPLTQQDWQNENQPCRDQLTFQERPRTSF